MQRTAVSKLAKLQVKIGGMSCSFCTESIRKACSRLEGVQNVSVSLAHEEALIQYDPSKLEPWQIEETLRSLGYTIRDPRKIRSFEEEEAELRRERKRLISSGIVTAIAAAMMIALWLGLPQRLGLVGADLELMLTMMNIGSIYLAVTNVFIIGFPILRMAFHSLRRRILNQHVLLEFGAFGGLAGGTLGFFLPNFPIADFFAVSVFITTYHILSGYASLLVRTRSSQAVRKVLAMQPPAARVVSDGKERMVPVEDVMVGDIVRVLPGESIPVDGVVADGFSTVDESIVTGEPIPVEKATGSEAIGGSINIDGSLKIKVTKIGQESFLQQVARYIEEARALKPGILQLLDVVLKYYVPGVLLFASAGFLSWSLGAWIFLGAPDIPRATFATLAVLVMGYPCALGMATPLATIRGGGMAALKGIIIRSSESFPAFKDVKKIVLDKTGTITVGKPAVKEVQAVSGYKANEVLWIAASLEKLSEHPLGKAIVRRAEEAGLKLDEPTDFRNHPGKGIKAILKGKAALVGNVRLFQENIDLTQAAHVMKGLEEEGLTVVAVSYDHKLVGLIGIGDQIKGDAAEAIAQLKMVGIEPIMITGDNERTARSVARQVGIERVLAQVLPDQKADRVRELQEQGYRVAMVGDGINDAPALMQADVGIAIGAGTDIAIESADIIIMGDRLTAVLDAYHIAKNSYNKTKQNLALAFAFNGIGVPAATTGLIHPAWAMIAMIASVSTVLANSFGGRLIPKAKPQKGELRKKTITLKVPTIHCKRCVSSLEETVNRIPGVFEVGGDHAQKLLVVSYHGGPETEERIRGEITKKGYVIG